MTNDDPEGRWQSTVTDLMVALGWTWAHFRTARTARGAHVTPVQGPGGAGFPDLTAWRPEGRRGPGRLVFVEVKAPGGYARRLQRAVLTSLALAGAEVYVARPEHYRLLVAVLDSRERPSPETAGALRPTWLTPVPTDHEETP